MRSLLMVLVLCSCAGYQLEPYVEYQLRDEGFDPQGGADEYTGNTYRIGLRYRSPSLMAETQFVRLTGAIRGAPIVIDHRDGGEGDAAGLAGDLVAGAGKAAKGFKNWPEVIALGIFAILILGVLWWFKWRPSTGKPTLKSEK